MTKDEMKDKISMAFKDPVSQQGFEIICKNLAELEKEKCELLGLIQAKDKLIEKMKRVKSVQKVGVKTMSQAARRLEILDKVLSLFGMRVGAYQTADMDIQGDIVVGVRLTIYFMSSR